MKKKVHKTQITSILNIDLKLLPLKDNQSERKNTDMPHYIIIQAEGRCTE